MINVLYKNYLYSKVMNYDNTIFKTLQAIYEAVVLPRIWCYILKLITKTKLVILFYLYIWILFRSKTLLLLLLRVIYYILLKNHQRQNWTFWGVRMVCPNYKLIIESINEWKISKLIPAYSIYIEVACDYIRKYIRYRFDKLSYIS